MYLDGNIFKLNQFATSLSDVTNQDTFVIARVAEIFEYNEKKQKTDKVIGARYDLNVITGGNFTLKVTDAAPLITPEKLANRQELDIQTLLAVDTSKVTIKPYDVVMRDGYLMGVKVSISTTPDAVELAEPVETLGTK